MNAELSQRVAQAFNGQLVLLAERKRVVDALQVSETFDDLPEDVQAIIKRLEAIPRG